MEWCGRVCVTHQECKIWQPSINVYFYFNCQSEFYFTALYFVIVCSLLIVLLLQGFFALFDLIAERGKYIWHITMLKFENEKVPPLCLHWVSKQRRRVSLPEISHQLPFFLSVFCIEFVWLFFPLFLLLYTRTSTPPPTLELNIYPVNCVLCERLFWEKKCILKGTLTAASFGWLAEL